MATLHLLVSTAESNPTSSSDSYVKPGFAASKTKNVSVVFQNIANTTVCGSLSVAWEYKGDGRLLSLGITNINVVGADVAHPFSQSLVNSVVGGTGVEWSPVTIPAGAFAAVMSAPEDNILFYLPTFYILEGTNSSCLSESQVAQTFSIDTQAMRTTPGLSQSAQSTNIDTKVTQTTPVLSLSSTPPAITSTSISPSIITTRSSTAESKGRMGGIIGGTVGAIVSALIVCFWIVRRKRMSGSRMIDGGVHVYPMVMDSNTPIAQDLPSKILRVSKQRWLRSDRTDSLLRSRALDGRPVAENTIQGPRDTGPLIEERRQAQLIIDPIALTTTGEVAGVSGVGRDTLDSQPIVQYTTESEELKTEIDRLQRDLERVTHERDILEEELARADETAPPSYSEPRNPLKINRLDIEYLSFRWFGFAEVSWGGEATTSA